MNESKFAKLSILLALFLSIGIVVFYLTTSTQPIGQKYRPISELGGPFTLETKQGKLSLSDIEGKVGVLYFGFLSCTEACPASIGVVQAAYKQLTKEERNNVQFLFISVDPERDSLNDLYDFGEYYNNDLVALTGTQEEIDKVTSDYGVFFELADLEGSALDYTVDHSSRFYMIDKSGDLFTTMSHSTTPTELAARIKQLMNTNTTSS
ncbi:SCO family protein [Alteromonas sp. 5E99-2]|uniref:SCO family protein n=1 Tax=Alteromonas sp. 5E99-2 TaxID=2817683 RepID=UPI001A988448|nr:SCO family protein [Alteromonas sp. 5E99-2]MBO1254197.1 SCO family protein [Alteromonas sp. 5E99-2]